MKITSVNVIAFGKLKNVTIKFNDGVNLLQQANGFGKSTLCAFIRAMLYGLNYNYKTVDGARANDVTRYMPWDSAQKFGGSMEISHEGKTYRIERFFGNTARSESLKVVDLSVGKQLDVQNVGEYFLGLTVESYDRSTYLPQEQVELASNENFDAKLANLVQDSTQDYDKLQEKLRAYKKKFKFERGFGGQIPTLQNEIEALQRQLQQAECDAQNRAHMGEQLKQVDAQLQQLTKEEIVLQGHLDELQQSLYQSKPSQADIDLANKIDELDLKIATTPQTVTDDYIKFNNLFDQKLALEKKANALALRSKVFAISFAIALVLGIALAIFQQYLYTGVAVLVSVGLAVGLLTTKGKKSQKQADGIASQLVEIASKYVNPNGKTLLELKDKFWQYVNDYQTNLSIRKALGEKPKINGDDGQIATQLQQTKLRMQALTEEKQSLVKTQHQLQFSLSQPVVSTVDIAEELFAKQQLLLEAKRKYDVATQTADILAQAKESLSSAYLPELCSRTEALLNSITNANYQAVTDRNFAISLQEKGQTKFLSAFSRGIREITLLCFRIALSQLLYGKDIPLLIVDDAFVNFDEQNFNRATQLLKQLSKTTQIIYFTCHNRTGNL